MATTADSGPDWRDLPPEQLTPILRSLQLADSVRLGAGCCDPPSEQGRCISSLSSLPPLKISDCSEHHQLGTQLERRGICQNVGHCHPLASKSRGEAQSANDVGLNSEGCCQHDFSGLDDSGGEDDTTDTTDSTYEELDLNWKDLIPDILYMIIKSLPLADSIRFGGVCTSWYSAVAHSCHPPAPQPPFLLLPGDSSGTSDIFQFFDLSYKKFYKIRLPQLRKRRCLGSSQGKLIYMDERSELQVLDPITGSEFDLPSITTFEDVGEPQFGEDGNVSGYLFDTDLGRTPPKFFPVDYFINNYYSKVIICPKTSAIVAISMQKLKIAVCLPEDKSWTLTDTVDPIDELPVEGFEDIVFYKDVLYAISCYGELLSFSFGDDLTAIKCVVLSRAFGTSSRKHIYSYIVEADGELLLVWRFTNYVNVSDTDVIFTGVASAGCEHPKTFVTCGFEVFRMDWGSMLWKEMKSLGEYALFLGLNSSFSLSSRDFPMLRENNIYFTDDDDAALALRPRIKRDMGVFSLEDGTIEPCYLCDGDLRLNWPPPIWFIPKDSNGLPSRYLNVTRPVIQR